MILEWNAFDGVEHCSVSRCGRYSVSTHNETWQAWRLAPGGPWFAPLGRNFASEAAAKEAAERDIASRADIVSGDAK